MKPVLQTQAINYFQAIFKIVGAAYQPGYFFFSDSLRSQAYEKVIPSSLHALPELLISKEKGSACPLTAGRFIAFVCEL